jgi:8-oxo-dGTP pyrophosphatase MutT (NUDIX family)
LEKNKSPDGFGGDSVSNWLLHMTRPRFASTVVVVRPDTNRGFEILLTRRPPQMRFMGGFYVFPGGTVLDSDYSLQVLERCRGVSADQARTILGNRHSPEVALGHWIAVVRELYEEVGILLCEAESGGAIDLRVEKTKARLELKRQAMVREELSFGEFLESEKLHCDLSRMVYFFHRVTPDFYPMRFDTRFYLATLPLHQVALRSSEEVTESLWISPEEALARADRDEFPVLPPTTTVLADLAQLRTWDGLLSAYRIA